MATVYLDIPLTPLEKPAICAACNEGRAKWRMATSDSLCSICLLFDTQWGKDNMLSIVELATNIETELRNSGSDIVLSNGDGILPEAADRIMASIVWASDLKRRFTGA